jgi:hypothetical protein
MQDRLRTGPSKVFLEGLKHARQTWREHDLPHKSGDKADYCPLPLRSSSTRHATVRLDRRPGLSRPVIRFEAAIHENEMYKSSRIRYLASLSGNPGLKQMADSALELIFLLVIFSLGFGVGYAVRERKSRERRRRFAH